MGGLLSPKFLFKLVKSFDSDQGPAMLNYPGLQAREVHRTRIASARRHWLLSHMLQVQPNLTSMLWANLCNPSGAVMVCTESLKAVYLRCLHSIVVCA